MSTRDEEIQELVQRSCAEAGIARAEFNQLCKRVGWYSGRAYHELQIPGWFDRLRAQLAEETERLLQWRAQRLCGATHRAMLGGPVSMLQIPEAELVAAVPAKLQKDALELQVGQGGRLVIGPTGSLKTWSCVALTRRIVPDISRRTTQARTTDWSSRLRPHRLGARRRPRKCLARKLTR